MLIIYVSYYCFAVVVVNGLVFMLQLKLRCHRNDSINIIAWFAFQTNTQMCFVLFI